MADANQDYYKILGVSRSASKAELKKAYHRLARKHHPDVNRGADAEEAFKRVNEAYEVLSNQKRRAAYDHVSRNWERDGRPAYYDSTILDEFIASYFDAKGDIQRQRACLFNCPHCSGETTVFFDYAVLNWQNFLKQCDVCKNFILIDYEVRKGKVWFFEARPRDETVRS